MLQESVQVGTIDDCGNEHPDASKALIMSNYECFKGVCELESSARVHEIAIPRH